MKITGAKVVIETLIQENVEVIFGYPGGAVLPIYDEIFKQKKIRHILVRHEQAAVHAADGFARATGKTGVALVTSGRSYKCHYRYRNGLYGFNSFSCYFRTSSQSFNWN